MRMLCDLHSLLSLFANLQLILFYYPVIFLGLLKHYFFLFNVQFSTSVMYLVRRRKSLTSLRMYPLKPGRTGGINKKLE